MKKLLLLLILSFFSAQGYAAGCPDGSQPVKSVSADGSYYEYTCNTSGGNDSNPLKQIKIVDNWSPVINFQAFKQKSKSTKYRINAFYMTIVKEKNLQCMKRLKTVNPYPAHDNGANENKTSNNDWQKCKGYINTMTKNDINPLQEILLSWAQNPKDVMKPRPNILKEYNVGAYTIPSTIGTFGQLYAIWYDDFNFTKEERKLVDAYMTRKLMEQKFPVINGDYKGSFRKCNPNNPRSVLIENVDSNNCGSIRIKVATAEIMLGLRLENQAMLDKGNDDVWYVLTQVDADGMWVNYAARGAKNFSYYIEYLHTLSVLTEVYYTLGYDFLETELKHGAKVHQIYYHGYELLKDHTYFGKYAKRNLGSESYKYNEVKNLSREEWVLTNSVNETYPNPDDDTDWINSHTRYVSKYMPHLPIILGFTDSPQSGTSNISVTPDMLYWGNTHTVESGLQLQETIKEENRLIQETIKEENRLRLKKNAEELKVKKAQEQEQLLAEIPIYDMNDEALILNLVQAEFFEISPPNQQNKNVGWETHKAEIYGELRLENFQIPKFRPLAFKFDVLNESRLSINVGELNAPEFRPFTRHQASLQKECGLGLMNEYDWMSFVSETTNMKSAKNQQCHYDYFKEENDEEAWKLFQAVLGGADSILKYLEENVER